MIKTITCIIAACDICGTTPYGLNDGDTHFKPDDQDGALTEAENCDWWTNADTSSVLCDKRDDAHLARAREIFAGLTEDVRITFLTYWPELDAEGRTEGELLTAYRAAP